MMMRTMRPRFSSTKALIVALALAVAACDGSDSRLVDDDAALLTPEQTERISEHHQYLRVDFGIDYRVVIAHAVGDIDRFAVTQFGERAIGASGADGRGLLLVIDPAQDLVRLEVGYALEGLFPDAFVAQIERQQMVPFFREDRVADGILATTELIIGRAQRMEVVAAPTGTVPLAGSGGAGAVTVARIGAGAASESRPPHRPALGPGAAPEETVRAYLQAMADRNGDPDLALYTPESRRMLRQWTMTPAQMSNIARAYSRCRAQTARLGAAGRLAVIRYPIDQRACAPWFLARGPEGWLLDLTMMRYAVRFGRKNAWRLDPSASHPYAFAFSDWRFDGNGFPIGTRARAE